MQEGDEVVISAMEHHANIVPWQQVCEQRSAVLKVIPVTEKGELNFAAYKDMLSDRVKIVAVGHVSNALGSVNPVKDIIFEAHRVGAKVLIDGAQSVPHFDIDVQDLNCDFYAFSGHKLFGPTGIGVLFGKEALLEAMPPYQVGGEMIDKVSFEKTTFNRLPYKFEAGTPHISGAVGLSAAISYLNLMDRQSLLAHENALLQLATKKMLSIEGIKLVGTAEQKAGVLSFMLEGVHPHDVGTLLDKQGVAVRTGHHCAMPIMQQFGIPGTIRASFSFYNNESDVDQLIEAVQKAKRFLL